MGFRIQGGEGLSEVLGVGGQSWGLGFTIQGVWLSHSVFWCAGGAAIGGG